MSPIKINIDTTKNIYKFYRDAKESFLKDSLYFSSLDVFEEDRALLEESYERALKHMR